jgi:hypothetical protein
MSFQSKGIGEVLADKVSEAAKPFKESTPAEEVQDGASKVADGISDASKNVKESDVGKGVAVTASNTSNAVKDAFSNLTK